MVPCCQCNLNMPKTKLKFIFIIRLFRPLLLNVGYFKTVGAMIMGNLCKTIVLMVIVKDLYFSSILYSVTPLTLSGVPCLNLVGSHIYTI